MTEAILILNAGSSSVKFSAFSVQDQLNLFLRGQIEGLLNSPTFRALDGGGEVVDERSWEAGARFGPSDAIEFLLTWCKGASTEHRLVAAGHRVVHGGAKYGQPVRINARTLRELEALVPFAPLHQPHNVAAIAAIARLAPDLPQVACFDTAFHRTQPAVAQAFALPREYTEAGLRRYGFHGLSYEYIAEAFRRVDAIAASGRVIVAHLGNGASLCALREGRSIATTMGFTALDGLMMGTRCGSIDPGVVLYLHQHAGLTIDQIQSLLYQQSGLLGVSGISADMRTLLATDDPRAREAIDLFVYRAAREIGSLAAALGGLDALIFTGGIGENAAAIRAAICDGCRWLGVELDRSSNARGGPRITRPDARATAWVLPTNEELMIARHTLRVIAGHPTATACRG